jgi:hypothetical protein
MTTTPSQQNYLNSICRILKMGYVNMDVCSSGTDKYPTNIYNVFVTTTAINKRERKNIARFQLSMMPGCCGICVSTDSFVFPDYRGKGIGTILNQLRQDIARTEGYSVMLCTDVVTNEAQRKLLRKERWLDLFTFRNRRTDNEVALTMKALYG